jgi:hypothetical protein
MMPKRFTTSQRQYLVYRAKSYVLQNGILYRFGQDNRFCHVLQPKHVPIILQELHSGVGGHFSSNITVKKIFDASYWWPIMNRDVYEFYWTYDLCQRTSNLLAQNMEKLITTLPKKPFQKWGLDFIGPINQ